MLTKKILFLDNHYLEKSNDTQRVFHQWQKETGNPVIKKKLNWEGIGPYGFTPTSFNSSPNLAWYVTFGGKKNDYPSGMLISDDKLNFNGERIAVDSISDGAQSTVHIQDEGENFGEYKYLGLSIYRADKENPVLYTKSKKSKDGIHWEYISKDECWIGPSDVLSIMYDKKRKKYIAYYKLWKVEGDTLDGKHFLSYFPSFRPTITKDTFRTEGFAVLPERKQIDITLQYGGGVGIGDGGGGQIDTKVTMIRIMARAQSSDFVHWEDEKVIIEPPEDAALGDQTYGMKVQHYGDLYIGTLNHFNALSGNINVLLSWSYDGIKFKTNYDNFVLPCSETGWDAGMLLPSAFYEDLNGQMCLYYGGVNTDHKVTDRNNTHGNIGRAWMRKDGFASLKNGIVITKPIYVDFDKISFNMKGIVRVKLLDINDEILEEADLFGDQTNIIMDFDFKKYAGQNVKISLDLSSGEAFAINMFK